MYTPNPEIAKIIYPLSYVNGCIVDKIGQVIMKMNREHDSTPLTPSYRDDLAKEIVELYNKAHSPSFLLLSWCTEDVIDRANDIEYEHEITEEQAIEILAMLDDAHDANVGINWEIIDIVTQQYFDEKEKEKELSDLSKFEFRDGNFYPYVEVMLHGNLETISTESLSKVLMNDDGTEPVSEEAERMDNAIYFYVPDEMITKPLSELKKYILEHE